MTQKIIISNFFRDAVAGFPQENAKLISELLPELSLLMEESDKTDDEIKALHSKKENLEESIQHYQERIRLFAIEKSERSRRFVKKDVKEEKILEEEKQNKAASDWLASLC